MNKIIKVMLGLLIFMPISINAAYVKEECNQFQGESKLTPEMFGFVTNVNIRVNDNEEDNNDKYAKQRLQNLLDCASELKIPILFNGHIKVPETVVLKKDTTITGNGIFWSWGPSTIMINGKRSDSNGGYTGNGNIHFEGISFHGNFAKFPDGKNLIEITHAKNVTFKDVKFYEPIDVHAIDLGGSEDVNITNCKFYGLGIVNGNKYKEAIQIAPVTASGSWVGPHDGTPCHRIKIEGCFFGISPDKELQSEGVEPFFVAIGSHGGVGDQRDSDIVINNNHFDSMTTAGIHIVAWNNVNITNNTFTDCKTGIKVSQHGSNSASICNSEEAIFERKCDNEEFRGQVDDSSISDVMCIKNDDGRWVKRCYGAGRGGEDIVITNNDFIYTESTSLSENKADIFYNNLQYFHDANYELTGDKDGKLQIDEPSQGKDLLIYEKNFEFSKNRIINQGSTVLRTVFQGIKNLEVFENNFSDTITNNFYNFKGINRPYTDIEHNTPKYAPAYSNVFDKRHVDQDFVEVGDPTIIQSNILKKLYTLPNIYNSYKNDFNGDGIADILLNKGKYASFWFMKDSGEHRFEYLNNMQEYRVADKADFNSDGLSDILLHKKTDDGKYRDVAIWYMAKDGTREHEYMGRRPSSYEIAGTGDFNGDGINDILWKKEKYLSMWLMKKERKAYDNIEHTDDTTSNSAGVNLWSYMVVGTGDFNRDGRSDILLTYNTLMAIRYANEDGKTFSHEYIGSQSKDYKVVNLGDFNGDGIDDVLWLKEKELSIWYMNSNKTVESKKNLTDAEVGNLWSYSIVDVADFNADGMADILLEYDNGTFRYLAIRYMNKNGTFRHTYIGEIDNGYTLP